MPNSATANTVRNIAGHGLTAAAVTVFLWLLWHIDGWFGHRFLPSEAHFAPADAVAVLWRIVPPLIVTLVVAAFLVPKTDIRMRTGGLNPVVTYSLDDPRNLAWPARLGGNLLALGALHLWGSGLVHLLAATIA